MHVIVPGRGWSVSDQGTGAETRYVLLGPLADGDYLRRASVAVWASANSQFNLAMSMGPNGEASALGLATGVPLISRGLATLDDVPALDMFVGAYGQSWLWIPVGIRGSVGARYVVAGLAYRTADVHYGVLIGLEVLRFARAPKEAGEA